jgi:hypothetical protein
LRVSTYTTLTTLLPLDNLTYLDLSHSEWLTEFPTQVLACTSLRKLDISGCRGLTDGRLPGCLSELQALEWLSADLCDIIAIGTFFAHLLLIIDLEISTLSKLHTLSLKFNRLDYLPAHLARLYPHLKLIALEGNPCYATLLPKPQWEAETPAPTPPQSSLRRLTSFPRLRSAKSTPNLRRSRGKTISSIQEHSSEQSKPQTTQSPSPESNRKSFFKQITPPLPSFTPRPRRVSRPNVTHSISEGLKRINGAAEVVGIAKELEWPVGPTPEVLQRKSERSRDSDSSEESESSSIDGSSPASSLSSPLGSKNALPLQGIDEISVDERDLTVRLLSRLRDLWELSNGDVCLSDHYIPSRIDDTSIDDFAYGLGIKLEEVEEIEASQEAAETQIETQKKAIGLKAIKRSNIIKEIIDTEETYIRGLQELADVPSYSTTLIIDLH